jgi:hypothetical protein
LDIDLLNLFEGTGVWTQGFMIARQMLYKLEPYF